MTEKDRELKLTYTSILLNQAGEKVVRVSFECQGEKGRQFAEGILPQAIIESSVGFDAEEVAKLEEYLKDNGADIMIKARQITGITHWLK